MREILFRGTRIDTGEWVYGFLYVTHNGEYEISIYSKEYNIERLTAVVIPETVGQYTCLTDKNGKKIFEGDIVHCYGGEYCQGYWEYNEIVIVDFDDYIAIAKISECEYNEVIGNIHDNPEMMKG